MDFKRLLRIAVTLLLVIGIIGLVASPAQADDRYFCVTTGDWNVAGNWDSDALCEDGNPSVPTAAHRAIIQSGQTCNMDKAAGEADTIEVESTAKLNVETGNVLTLDGSVVADAGISTINGAVKLEGSGSELAFKDNDQTLDGSGSIVGHNSAAEISITSGETLTNEITIHGTLVINGDGTFDNQGTVQADGGTVLHVNSGGVDDTAGATWTVAATLASICGGCLPSVSTLRFNVPLAFGQATHFLAGDFTVTSGSLDVDVAFKTTGRLTHNSGTIDVDSSASCTFDD